MELIFCGGNNPTFCQIALDAGYKYGARLPCQVYAPLYFADQDWENPDRATYMAALKKYHPFMASVMDWEKPEQLPEVLSWAEEAAQWIDVVMIVPKVFGGISLLPRYIGGKPVRFGYSVPNRPERMKKTNKWGGNNMLLTEFIGLPVHLLGGSPGAQMYLYQYLDVQSADGNMAMKMANRGLYWLPGKSPYTNHWASILEMDGRRWDGDGNYEAFRRSCHNILWAWRILPVATSVAW